MSERLIPHADFGLLAGEVLRKGGIFRFQANGNSMRPFIYNNETVELVGVDPQNICPGDIVLYWLVKDALLLHRVVRVQKNADNLRFIMQGDAACRPEGAIPAENVLGKASSVFRKGKWRTLDAFPISFFARLWMITIPARLLVARLSRLVNRFLSFFSSRS